MHENEENLIRVLALYPNPSGFGYVVMENAEEVLAWEVKRAHGRNKNTECLERVRHLIQHWQPSVVLIEDYTAPASRRNPRIKHFLLDVEDQVRKKGIVVSRVSRTEVRRHIGGANKDEMARLIVERLPELADTLPPVRRAYDTEHWRMAIFEAAAIGVYYCEALGVPGNKPNFRQQETQ